MNKTIPLAPLCSHQEIRISYTPISLNQRLMSAIVEDAVAKTCAGEKQATIAAQLSSASSNRLGNGNLQYENGLLY
jgi:hypothetical protein